MDDNGVFRNPKSNIQMKLIDLIKKIDTAKSKAASTRARNKFVAACHKMGVSSAALLSKVTAADHGAAEMPPEANYKIEE